MFGKVVFDYKGKVRESVNIIRLMTLYMITLSQNK
jgi:hypothetical protein